MVLKLSGTQGSLAQAAGAALVIATVPQPVVQEGAGGLRRRRDQRGMVTAEWAMALIAALGIAGVLIAVVTNGTVETALLGVVQRVVQSILDAIPG